MDKKHIATAWYFLAAFLVKKGKVSALLTEKKSLLEQLACRLFFHRSALQGEGFDTLADGQAVEFDVERGEKGPRAANMKVSPSSA